MNINQHVYVRMCVDGALSLCVIVMRRNLYLFCTHCSPHCSVGPKFVATFLDASECEQNVRNALSHVGNENAAILPLGKMQTLLWPDLNA